MKSADFSENKQYKIKNIAAIVEDFLNASCRKGNSIKTRIETIMRDELFYHQILVEKAIPLKQGLKQRRGKRKTS